MPAWIKVGGKPGANEMVDGTKKRSATDAGVASGVPMSSGAVCPVWGAPSVAPNPSATALFDECASAQPSPRGAVAPVARPVESLSAARAVGRFNGRGGGDDAPRAVAFGYTVEYQLAWQEPAGQP